MGEEISTEFIGVIMSWRTVLITKQCKLDYKMGYLVVRDEEVKRIFLDEIAILTIENPAVSLTGCLIEALIENKIKVIFCDSKRSPTAELVPYHGSHDSSLKIRTQAKWQDDIKGIVWCEIVSEKIRKQTEFLMDLGKEDEFKLLSSYIGQVQLLDETNREGHAAKVYFNALFGMKFTRGADIPINAALNYGYSIILSAFNREIANMGYLTQLGIFHNNMFNHFNLSCDLMEPFRILIDRYVYSIMPEEFTKEIKYDLWNILNLTVSIDGKNQTVLNAIKIYTRSVFEAINDNDVSKILFFNLI